VANLAHFEAHVFERNKIEKTKNEVTFAEYYRVKGAPGEAALLERDPLNP
jgi:hypothetical protein